MAGAGNKFDVNSCISSLYRYNGLLVAEYQDSDGIIEIVEQDGIRRLHFGSGALQSCMSLSDPVHLCAAYERTMMALLLFNPAPARTLMIGLGGGSVTRFLLQHNEHGRLHVVELRALVAEVARHHFLLPDDARLQLTLGCGAQHVAQQHAQDAGRYEVIVVDAYQGGGMAPEVTSEDFFRHCHQLLDEQGLLVINLWRSEKAQVATITRHLVKFFNWRVHFLTVRDSNNLIGFAFAAGHPPHALPQLEAAALALQQRLRLDFPDYLQQLKPTDPLGSLFIDV